MRTNSKGEPVEVVGPVEKKFREMAASQNLTPGELYAKMVEEGTPQISIARALNCSRQAVAFMARKFGVEFPGRRLDVDERAREVSGKRDFSAYFKTFGETVTYEQMSEQLGVSVSTVKRRAKKLMSGAK